MNENSQPYLNCRTMQSPKREDDIQWETERFERYLTSRALMQDKLGVPYKKMPWLR